MVFQVTNLIFQSCERKEGRVDKEEAEEKERAESVREGGGGGGGRLGCG
jgi:hypothetical protein